MKEAQKEVVERLLLPYGFAHIRVDNDDHAGSLNDVFKWLPRDRPVVLLDVDCVPLDTSIVQEGVSLAEEGFLVGAMQAANHIDPDEAYIGPFFWIGIPNNAGLLDFRATEHADVAQRVSRCWVYGKQFLFPISCREPRWKVRGMDFGLGTQYGDNLDGARVYHEFCSRDRQGVQEFIDVCEEVLRS